MEVSDADRQHMQRLAGYLAAAEVNDEPDAATRAARIEAANQWRAAHGIPPLEEADAHPPELEFHHYARALGLTRRRG